MIYRIILPLIGWMIVTNGMAQIITPTPYLANTKINYTRIWEAKAPEQSSTALPGKAVKDVKQTTQYFDGLGRPFQTVVKKTGDLQKDMVIPILYDEFGREQYKYLPFVSTSTSGGSEITNDGNFKLNPFQQDSVFSKSQYNSETYYYSQSVFEASPLNRPLQNFAPGNSWVGSKGSGTDRSINSQYLLNTLADSVRLWTIAAASGSLPTSTATYAAGQLLKNVTADENNNQVVEYKDKEGRIQLKKVQLGNTPGTAHVGWLCTYYVYDDMSNLRFVIQPKVIELIWSNWSLTTEIAFELCFRYEYDQRNRMITKKVPGSGEEYMVYDSRDRLVASSTAVGRSGLYTGYCFWNFTLYDALNRPVATGEMHTCIGLSAMISYVNGLNNADVAITSQPGPALPITAFNPIVGNAICTVCSNWNINTIIHYDDYAGLPAGLSDFLTTWNSIYFSPTDNVAWPYPQLPQKSTATRGMPTWTSTRVLGTGAFLNAVTYFDDKGRVIQVQNTNITNGLDVSTTQYTWAGQPLITVMKQEKAGTAPQTSIVVSRLTYDDLGRIISSEKRISNTLVNGNAMSAYTTVSSQEYDALGQLKKKSLGSKKDPVNGNYYTTRQQLAALDYEYNIRGWLLSINKSYITAGTNNDKYFGMQLGYDKDGALGTFTNKQFNGNISGTLWKSEGDKQQREYDFSYDAVNRLTGAQFGQYLSGAGSTAVFNTVAGVNFTVENLAYDANGNILSMRQYGIKGVTSSVVDDMLYTYMPFSNKLKNVRDGSNDAVSKLGDFKTSTLHPQSVLKTGANTQPLRDAITDYNYDANGNLIRDFNKDIATPAGADGIKYNHLNLPTVITIKKDNSTANKGTITYTYDATGNKLKKVTVDIGMVGKTITTTTTYISGFVYESKITLPANTPNDDYTDRMQFVPQEEGRIRCKPLIGTTPASLEYDYMIKDHLGNVRMVLTEEVQQITYPAATLESAVFNGGTAISVEDDYYNVTAANVVLQSAAFGIPAYPNINSVPNNNPYSNPAANSASLYKLDASTNSVPNKTGLGIVLKVMSGDNINIFGNSYHKKPVGGYTSLTNPLGVADIIGLLTGTALIAGKGITTTQITGQTGFPASVTSLLNNQPSQNSTTPRAGINWIILDEQFKYVSGGFDMVGDAGTCATCTTGTFKTHTILNINVPKNGYIYVYCSNESQYSVFFDNLQVIHKPGPILEETHYYPFGLTMAGISSKAAGCIENKRKWNKGSELESKEFSDGSGLELYSTFYRSLDPQLGRWWSVDPKPYYSESPYVSMSNNPILKNDPLGDVAVFYNQKGQEIYRMDDGNKYITATEISNKNLASFNKAHSGEGFTVGSLQKMGTTYDTKSINEFFKNNSKKTPAKIIDGKYAKDVKDFKINGKPATPYSEVQANTVSKNGVVSINQSSAQPSSSGADNICFPSDLPNEPNKAGDAHLHPYKPGDKITYSYGPGGRVANSVSYPYNLSGDQGHAADNYEKNGVRTIVVDAGNIYLLNGETNQIIKITR